MSLKQLSLGGLTLDLRSDSLSIECKSLVQFSSFGFQAIVNRAQDRTDIHRGPQSEIYVSISVQRLAQIMHLRFHYYGQIIIRIVNSS